jgi:hypothetical protein
MILYHRHIHSLVNSGGRKKAQTLGEAGQQAMVVALTGRQMADVVVPQIISAEKEIMADQVKVTLNEEGVIATKLASSRGKFIKCGIFLKSFLVQVLGKGSSSVSRNETDSTKEAAASTTIPNVVTTPIDAVLANPASPRTSFYPRSVSSPVNKANRPCLELRYPEATPEPSPLSKVTSKPSSSGTPLSKVTRKPSSSKTPLSKVKQEPSSSSDDGVLYPIRTEEEPDEVSESEDAGSGSGLQKA